MLGQAQLPVDLGFVGRVGFAEHGQQISWCLDHAGDLLSGHPPATGWTSAETCLRGGEFGLRLVDPAGDDLRAGACFERGAVLAEARVGVRDLLLRGLAASAGRGLSVVLGVFEFPDRCRESDRRNFVVSQSSRRGTTWSSRR